MTFFFSPQGRFRKEIKLHICYQNRVSSFPSSEKYVLFKRSGSMLPSNPPPSLPFPTSPTQRTFDISSPTGNKPLELIPQLHITPLRLPPPPTNNFHLPPQRLQPPLHGDLLGHGERLEGREGGLGGYEVRGRGYDFLVEGLLALLVAAQVEGEFLLGLGGGAG